MPTSLEIESRPREMEIFRVAEWTVRRDAGTVTRGDQKEHLQPKVMEVLVYLAINAGRVISKDEIFEAVWPQTAVEDGALTQCIHAIRRAFQDDARQPRYVQTVPRKGYRLVAAEPPRRFPGNPPPRWNVPFARNPYFTGREQQLDELDQALAADGAVALGQTQAFSGLGGVGKTQTAVEYAYRYRDCYETVFWVRFDTAAAARAGLTEIARLLDLDEKDAQDEDVAVKAVHRWLEQNGSWLLIFDNADNPADGSE